MKYIILLLLLTACTSIEETVPADPTGHVAKVENIEYEPEPAPVEPETEEVPVVEIVEPDPEPEPAKVEETVPEVLSVAPIPPAPNPVKESEEENSAELESLLLKADEKITSYSFMYAPPPDNAARNNFFVRGDKIKVKLFEQNVVDPKTNIDTIYLDTTKKSAVAYCEDHRILHCANKSKEFPVVYDEFILKTPYQWMKEVKNAKIQGSEMLWGRLTNKVYYVQDGNQIWQWIDTHSGLPVKIVISYRNFERSWEFRDLAINNVAADDVEPDPTELALTS